MIPPTLPGLPRLSVLHVLAGVLLDAKGCVLLAQRPPGKQLAGQWEFPGGKQEAGETALQALARELSEELDIAVDAAEPLLSVPWHAGARDMVLEAWRVWHWHGTPRAMEGQVLQWQWPAQVDPLRLTAADRPILQAVLRLF